MLKNKFGMTKILVLVLSVLMLVSLVACNKADGPSTDDMNAAIQAAIDAANAEQAAKEAALAASIAADKAAQEAKDAALAESMAKEKAENDAALKKAQEEAKAAADAAAKASEAAKAAADKAAKEAADAAAKAASEAAKKAQEAADKQASELAAALEAAKAEALKAAEEASKAQAEASKAIEEASKAAEEAAKASSQLAETTVAPATTPAETTVVVPGETTVVTPVAPVDKTEVLTAFSKLKTEYTYTNENLYNAAEYAELVMLFDKASLDLSNAATVEAATAVLETLKVDAAAVRSVKSAAAEVAALVNALGDIETEVFTTQAEKITEAQKAYTALKKEYASYFGYNKDTKKDNQNGKDTVKIATKLGINVADLNKAAAKVVVLKDYIEDALYDDMAALYGFETSTYAKLSAFDAEEVYTTATKEGATAAEKEKAKATYNLIKDAYYKYLVLSVVNYGDFGKGVEIDWEMKKDENGNKVIDTEKPIEWFTTEQLLNTFILPTLDVEFADYLGGLLSEFETGMTGLVAALNDANDIVELAAKDVDTDDVYDALKAKFEAMSFVNDYKADKTLDDAKVDANIIAIKAYIEAMNVYLDAAKETAIEAKKESTEDLIQKENDKIDDAQDDMTDASATTIARLEGNIAKYKANIESLEAKEASYIANVEAAALLTFEEMLNADLNETTAYKNKWADITDFDKYTATQIETFLNLVLENTINTNFADEITDTPDDPMLIDLETLRANVVKDLEELILLVSPYTDEYRKDHAEDGDVYEALVQYYGTYDVDAAGESLAGQVKNTQFFLDVIAALDTAIEGIEAVSADDYDPKPTNVTFKNDKGKSKTWYFVSVNTYNYAVANYDYDPADFDSIDAVIAANDKLSSGDKLLKDSATDYPLQFVITPAEQAIEEVAKQYVAAFKAFSNTISAETERQKGYAKAAKLLITNSTTKTTFDTLISNTSGQLQTEMKNVRDDYTSAIDGLVKNYEKNFTASDKVLKADKIYKVNTLYRDDSADTQSKNYAANGYYVFISTTANYSDYYDYDLFKDAVDAKAKDFYKKVFNLNDVDTDTTAKDNVSEFWNVKLTAVAELNRLRETYKNNYTTNSETGVTNVAHKSGMLYKYGVEGAGAQPAYVATYEEKLDELFDTAIANIMALEIRKSSRTIITDAWTGKAITAQFKAIGEVTATTDSTKFEDADGSKINYDMTKAKNAVQAYMDALLGTAGTWVQANNAPAGANNKYNNGNSEIFKWYNSIVLGNSYGYSKTTVTVE